MSTFSQINTNIQSQQAFQNLSETSEELATRRERLTTGLRINSAEDDAAGFEIANQLEAKTGAQDQALRNIGDAKSLLSTAEGSLDSQLSILQTAKEKATQAANDSLSDSERQAIQGELDELASEVQDIAKNTTFNGQELISGGGSNQTFQTGAGTDNTFDVSLSDSTATNLGIGTDTSNVETGSSTFADNSNNTLEDGDFNFTGNKPDLVDSGSDDNSVGSSINGGNSLTNGDGELANLEGGEFTIEVTNKGSNTFEFQVNGSGGPAETVTDDGSGKFGDSTGDSDTTGDDDSVTLEKDPESGDTLELDLSSVDESTFSDQLGTDETGSFKVEVGGDGIEFKNDVTKNASERESAITNIDNAIDTLTGNLSDLGATQNRLSFKESNLETARTNLNSAQSRIEDADFAKEQTQVAKLQVQQQSGTAQLAQANAAGQGVLSLLQ